MCVSNACNMEFRLFIILGNEVIRTVFTGKNFSFIIKGFVLQPHARQALTSVFESVVSCAFITARILIKWFHTI